VLFLIIFISSESIFRSIIIYIGTAADQLEKKSLQYLQIQDRPISKPHNIWQSTGNDPISIKSGEIKSKLVTAYLHPVYPDIIHFLNYPDILVFSGGAFPVYFSD
jgi:hypothetical protein